MKRALIVYPSEWIAYSPTILNLVQCLRSDQYEVKVIAVSNTAPSMNFNNRVHFDVDYIQIADEQFRQLSMSRSYKFYKFLKLIEKVDEFIRQNGPPDIAFGVDSVGFLACRLRLEHTVFLSLEIERDTFFQWGRRLGIRHLCIQSKVRKDYLFGEDRVPFSILPNSPLLSEDRSVVASWGGMEPFRILYMGTFIPEHGVEGCIEALHNLPSAFCLTLKGPSNGGYVNQLRSRYSELLDSGRLTIDTSYTDQELLLPYIRQFHLGLCLYDFSKIASGDFNYISSPSGKLFNYYGAGIPVIGNDIIGLKSVEDFQAGILLSDLSKESVANAVIRITECYADYREGSERAAVHYDFESSYRKLMFGLTVEQSREGS